MTKAPFSAGLKVILAAVALFVGWLFAIMVPLGSPLASGWKVPAKKGAPIPPDTRYLTGDGNYWGTSAVASHGRPGAAIASPSASPSDPQTDSQAGSSAALRTPVPQSIRPGRPESALASGSGTPAATAASPQNGDSARSEPNSAPRYEVFDPDHFPVAEEIKTAPSLPNRKALQEEGVPVTTSESSGAKSEIWEPQGNGVVRQKEEKQWALEVETRPLEEPQIREAAVPQWQDYDKLSIASTPDAAGTTTRNASSSNVGSSNVGSSDAGSPNPGTPDTDGPTAVATNGTATDGSPPDDPAENRVPPPSGSPGAAASSGPPAEVLPLAEAVPPVSPASPIASVVPKQEEIRPAGHWEAFASNGAVPPTGATVADSPVADSPIADVSKPNGDNSGQREDANGRKLDRLIVSGTGSGLSRETLAKPVPPETATPNSTAPEAAAPEAAAPGTVSQPVSLALPQVVKTETLVNPESPDSVVARHHLTGTDARRFLDRNQMKLGNDGRYPRGVVLVFPASPLEP